jgi:hypothetical protein
VSSEHHVLQTLFPEHPSNGFLPDQGKLVLGAYPPPSFVAKVELFSRLKYENDYDLGVSVIDSFTHYVLEYMESINKTSHFSMQDLVRPYVTLHTTFQTMNSPSSIRTTSKR